MKYTQIALLAVLQLFPTRSGAGTNIDLVTRVGAGVSVRYEDIYEQRVSFPLVVQVGIKLDKMFYLLLSGSFPVIPATWFNSSTYGSLVGEFHFLPTNKFIDTYLSAGIGYGITCYSFYDSTSGFESGIFSVGAGIEIPVKGWLQIGFRTEFILRFPAKENGREKHYFESQDLLLMVKMCF